MGMSERERYDEMMKEVTSPATVLYFHGGAYWLMDPSTHRPLTQKLAKLTGGRVYSVRYRLSPKHAFPAALIDGLVSYLALLFPPEDAFHTAVRAEDVVFSGDRYVTSPGFHSLGMQGLTSHPAREETSPSPSYRPSFTSSVTT